MVLEFLLRHPSAPAFAAALAMAEGTCEAMARGGMYDQLGGGFARYSVDADWVVPHFEKMLYDNALLLVSTRTWRRTGSPLARRVARADLRLDAARPAHRRGRIRLRAGRRQRRRRGPVLRVDARPSWARSSAPRTASSRPSSSR